MPVVLEAYESETMSQQADVGLKFEGAEMQMTR